MQHPTTTRAWAGRRRTPTKGDRRYDQLYEAAAELFYQKGYASTSLQDLADAIGLQKGSLYHYIDSKEDLLFGIAQYSHEFFTELVVSQDATSGKPSERLTWLLFGHAKFAVENFHTQAAFYNERQNLSIERQNMIMEIRDTYEKLLRDLVEEGQACGEFIPTLPPKIAVFGMLGMINWINIWYQPSGELTADEIAAAFSAMAVRSISLNPVP